MRLFSKWLPVALVAISMTVGEQQASPPYKDPEDRLEGKGKARHFKSPLNQKF
jgi:hypothetical protein